MKVGKVSERILKELILKGNDLRRKESILGPNIGQDVCLMALEPDDLLVLSTDPITATEENIGKLAVHINVNDLAAGGAEPIGLLLTVLMPRGYTKTRLARVADDIKTEMARLNIDLLGGHTEITDAVNQLVISVTAIGKIVGGKNKKIEKAQAKDQIVMTKWAGLEGTAIIAEEKNEEISKRFGQEFLDRARGLIKDISVLAESRIGVKSSAKVKAMHDITEGGVLGALWELASLTDMGMEIYLDEIPILRETIEISDYYGINPYKLIGSGSMLMVAKDGKKLCKELEEQGINAKIIGSLVEGNSKKVYYADTHQTLRLPEEDELYKVIKRSS